VEVGAFCPYLLAAREVYRGICLMAQQHPWLGSPVAAFISSMSCVKRCFLLLTGREGLLCRSRGMFFLPRAPVVLAGDCNLSQFMTPSDYNTQWL
jgi:hypothetical protein